MILPVLLGGMSFVLNNVAPLLPPRQKPFIGIYSLFFSQW